MKNLNPNFTQSIDCSLVTDKESRDKIKALLPQPNVSSSDPSSLFQAGAAARLYYLSVLKQLEKDIVTMGTGLIFDLIGMTSEDTTESFGLKVAGPKGRERVLMGLGNRIGLDLLNGSYEDVIHVFMAIGKGEDVLLLKALSGLLTDEDVVDLNKASFDMSILGEFPGIMSMKHFRPRAMLDGSMSNKHTRGKTRNSITNGFKKRK